MIKTFFSQLHKTIFDGIGYAYLDFFSFSILYNLIGVFPVWIIAMNDLTLKVVGKVFEPFVFECGLRNLSENDNCRNPGLDAAILGDLLRDIGLSYTIYEADEDFGLYFNNTWTGLYASLQNNTYDTLLTSMVITQPRIDSFHVTYAVDYLPYAFIVKRFPESFHDSFRLLFEPFSFELWLLQAVTIFCLFLAGALPKLIYDQKLNFKAILGHIGRTGWSMYRYALGQGKEVPFEKSRLSGTIMTLMFFLLLPFTVNLYQNALLSHLYVKYPKPPFKTLDELVTLIEKGRYQLVSDKNDLSFFEDMDTSPDAIMIRMKAVMDQNLVHYAEDEEDALRHVSDYNYVYPSTLDEAAYLLKDRCDFQLIVDKDRTQQLVYLFNKNIPQLYIRQINAAIGKSWPRVEYYKNKYYLNSLINVTKCLSTSNEWASKLSLTNLGGLIYCCLFNIALALTIFAAELIHFKRSRSRSYPQSLVQSIRGNHY